MDWFQQVMGFKEHDFFETQDNLVINGNKIKSKVNNKEYVCGYFSNPSLNELRSQIPPSNNQKTTISEVVSDVVKLHKSNEGAVFQVASQFNCLEMIHPGITKYDGVWRYEHDYTQGPVCAMACGPGTIYRNYFENTNNLSDFDSSLWHMQNGYCLPYKETVHLLDNIELNGRLRIGIQQDTEVLENNQSTGKLVTQVYCSALPISYLDYKSNHLDKFAKQILFESYLATLYVGVLNYQRTGNNKVFLTLLGGGAFGNNKTWIIEAINKAIAYVINYGLDIQIVSYGKSDLRLQQLVEKLNEI